MQRRIELAVGSFVLIGLGVGLLFLLTFDKLSMKSKYYTLHIKFTNVGNLEYGTSVILGGVKVGKVDDIYIEDGNVIANILIYNKVKVGHGAKVKIVLKGIIGEVTISIYNPQKYDGIYKDGDTIIGTDPVSLDEMFELGYNIMDISNDLLSKAGDIKFEDLNEVIYNLKTLSENLNIAVSKSSESIDTFNEILSENSEGIKRVVENSEKLSSNLNSAVVSRDKQLKEVLNELSKIIKTFDEVVDENRELTNKSVENMYIVSNRAKELLNSIDSESLIENQEKIGTILDDTTEIIDKFNKSIDEKKVKDVQNGIDKAIVISKHVSNALNNEIYLRAGGDYSNVNNLRMNVTLSLRNIKTDYYSKLGIIGINKNRSNINLIIGKKTGKFSAGIGILESDFGLEANYNYSEELDFGMEYYDLIANHLNIYSKYYYKNFDIELKYDIQDILYTGVGYRF